MGFFFLALKGHNFPVIAPPFGCSCFYSWQLFSLQTVDASNMIGQYHWGLWRQACTCVYSTWGSQRRPCVECMFVFVCLLLLPLLSHEHFMFAIFTSGARLPLYSTEGEPCRCSEDGCPVFFSLHCLSEVLTACIYCVTLLRMSCILGCWHSPFLLQHCSVFLSKVLSGWS